MTHEEIIDNFDEPFIKIWFSDSAHKFFKKRIEVNDLKFMNHIYAMFFTSDIQTGCICWNPVLFVDLTIETVQELYKIKTQLFCCDNHADYVNMLRKMNNVQIKQRQLVLDFKE